MNTDALIAKLTDYGADTQGALERFIGDKELYESCLQLFMQDKGFAALGEALDAKNYKAAFDAAHTLKGVAGNLGVTPLYASICEIVEELRGNHTEQLAACYDKVSAEFSRLKALMEN